MRGYKLHPLYWKFKFQNWSLEDFVRRSPRENVQCKILAGAEYEKPCTAEICETAKENLVRYFTDLRRTRFLILSSGENLTLDVLDRKSTRLNSSHRCISYAV